MSEDRKQQISAFMDGELNVGQEQTINSLKCDADLQQAWQRYHLISDSLKHALPEYFDKSLAQRISSAIKSEPAILVPAGNISRGYLKPVAGLALAASVAAIAILGIKQHRETDMTTSTEQVSVAQQLQNDRQRQFTFPSRQVSLEVPQQQLRDAAVKSRLNSYLVNYNEYRTHSGMQGMLPYVRIVAHGNDE